jgi:hypothetical protein
MAQYVQFVAERLGPTTNMKNQIFVVKIWDISGAAVKVAERGHTLVQYRWIKMLSFEVQSPLVRLCFYFEDQQTQLYTTFRSYTATF